MTTIGEAIIEVHGDTSRFDSDVRRGTSPGKMSALGKVAGKGLAVGFTAAAGAVLAGGAFLKGAFDEAQEARKVGALTAAVIESTGGVANVSAKHVDSFSEALSNKIAVDDEAIASGMNMLLTFSNVRNEVGKGNKIFDRATVSASNMAAAFGGDAVSNSKMLGKALNDPTKGVSALTRVGVSFTQQQKDQIAAMQESGDMLGAQKIILAEVEKQTKGAAESQATGAERAKIAWANLKEQVGTALMPVFERLFTFLATRLIPFLSTLGPTFTSIASTVGPVIAQIVGFIRGLTSGTGEAGGSFAKLRETISSVFTSIKSVISDAVVIIRVLWQTFGQNLIASARSTFANIMQVIRGALQIVAGIFKVIRGVLTGDWRMAWEGIKQIVRGAWNVISGIVKQGWNLVRTAFSSGASIVKGIFSGLWNALRGLVSAGWSGIKSLVVKGVASMVLTIAGAPAKVLALGSKFLDAGRSIMSKIFEGIKGAATGAGGLVSDIASAIKGAINSALNLPFTIKGPGPLPDFTIPAFARGGTSRGGLALVGEEGPELVELARGDKVNSHPDTLRMARRAAVAAPGGTSALRLVSGTLTIDERGRAFIRGIAADEIEDAAEFGDTLARMGG